METTCRDDISTMSHGTDFKVLRILFSDARKGGGGSAIFIDRDGVINQRRPDDYVLDWSQFVFVPGIREALRQLTTLGLPLIVISNQAAVGKGLLSLNDLREITTRMQQLLLKDGIVLAAAYYCPHRSEDGCGCRKPKPGLLVAAAEDFEVDLARSVFIGDSITDVGAAEAVGVQPLVFAIGRDALSSNFVSEAMEIPAARTAQELFDQVVTRLR